MLGSPISHSLSPALHRAAYEALGLAWSYDAIEVQADGLAGFLAGLDDTWAGLSLTMPLKEAVLPLLDTVSPLATATQSANTVVLDDTGRHGYNTDVAGIVSAIRSAAPGTGFGRACLIGAGATSRSAAAAAAQLGAQDIVVLARRPRSTGGVRAAAAAAGVSAVTVLHWDEAGQALAADLVISTVPGDAGAGLAHLVPGRPGVLLDVTYRPWPTTLAAAWSEAGGRVVPGSQMLLWQAARQVELMTGRSAPIAAMAAALDGPAPAFAGG